MVCLSATLSAEGVITNARLRVDAEVDHKKVDHVPTPSNTPEDEIEFSRTGMDSKRLRTSDTSKYHVGEQPVLSDPTTAGWFVHAIAPDDSDEGPGIITICPYPVGVVMGVIPVRDCNRYTNETDIVVRYRIKEIKPCQNAGTVSNGLLGTGILTVARALPEYNPPPGSDGAAFASVSKRVNSKLQLPTWSVIYTGYSGILLYYFQVLNMLMLPLTSDSTALYITALTDLNLGAFAASIGEWCPIEGLGSVGKAMLHSAWASVIVGMYLAVAVILGTLSCCAKNKERQTEDPLLERESVKDIIDNLDLSSWCKSRLYLFSIFPFVPIVISLFVFSSFSKVAFSLVHCQEINGQLVLYISGHTECFGGASWWQFAVLGFIALLVIPFPVFIVFTRRGLHNFNWKPLHRVHGLASLRALEAPFFQQKKYWVRVYFLFCTIYFLFCLLF